MSLLAYAVKFAIVKKKGRFRPFASWDNVQAPALYILNAKHEDGSIDCRIAKFDDGLANPDGFGLTEWEKNELPHLRDVVWERILAPLSHTPQPGWSQRLSSNT